MTQQAASQVFGKRTKQHIIILASGEKIRHLTIKPWMAGVAFCFFAVFTIGYFSATSYLVMRDGLIGASMARQARMQYEYEDRIAALRAQVDRVTSRQLLDQQVVEQKVETLLKRQLALSDRHQKIDSLIERTGISDGVDVIPVPEKNPRRTASAAAATSAFDSILGKSPRLPSTANAFVDPVGQTELRKNEADQADEIFSNVTKSLKHIEHEQLARIQDLTRGASGTAEAIVSIMKKTGVAPTDATEENTALGGPFMAPMAASDQFDNSLTELDAALQRLEKVRSEARNLPFGNPAPGSQVTSRFGNRVDPFLGRAAFHAGIDFRGKTGTPVHVTGAGTVVRAGRAGGYGNMVEVRHKNGVSTRYGHLSRILVKTGDHVELGDRVGLVGSTGRSTGPHLHYEVRRNGRAINPVGFLNAGLKLNTYLD